jgi:hypothetical protein
MSNKLSWKPLAAAALLAATGAAQATITVYTTEASFLAAVTNPGVDGFDGFSIIGGTLSPMNRMAGDYGYTADAGPAGGFFGAGSPANPWLSTNIATDTISFFNFTGGVAALGGNFFGSNIVGEFTAGAMTLTATDADGMVTQTIVDATTSSFVGFVSSTGTLVSATLASVEPTTGFLWPTVDNLTLAAPIPEPETYALMLAGLGLMGFMARRRRG